MKKVFRFNYVFIFLLIFSCGKPLPSLKNIDLKSWAEDKNACNGMRSAMLGAITSQKDELLGLTEMQIIELLGTPDNNELYKRNQKFYYYSLQPSQHCTSHIAREPLQLIVRFTAMGVAKEVSIST